MRLLKEASKAAGKIYVYPDFKAKYGDYFFFRLNGSGLGNNLFVWAKYILFIQKYNAIPIAPTWIQFNFTKSKHLLSNLRRHNIGLFKSTTDQIGGLRKLLHLIFKEKVDRANFELALIKNPDKIQQFDEKIILVSGMDDYFEYIMHEYNFMRKKLIESIHDKHKIGLDFNFTNSITVHVRLGDFISVTNDSTLKSNNTTRLDLYWYISIVSMIRKSLGYSIKVLVFSDGTDKELKPILDLPYTYRLSFGSAMADLLALSRSNILVASGSTYSMWASFLGRMPVIWYNGKLKQKVYFDQPELELECDTTNQLTIEQLEIILNYVNKVDAEAERT